MKEPSRPKFRPTLSVGVEGKEVGLVWSEGGLGFLAPKRWGGRQVCSAGAGTRFGG